MGHRAMARLQMASADMHCSLNSRDDDVLQQQLNELAALTRFQ